MLTLHHSCINESKEYLLIFKYLLFTIVMATIPTISKLLPSTSSGTDEKNRINYEINLSAEYTDIEINMYTRAWSVADRKKLQHMMECPPRVSACL